MTAASQTTMNYSQKSVNIIEDMLSRLDTTASQNEPKAEIGTTDVAPELRIPVIDKMNASTLGTIYDQSTFDANNNRIEHLLSSFREVYNDNEANFIVRSPGRVNIIGEHIDYCGYSVLPMAVEKDILFAVQILSDSDHKITISNIEPRYQTRTIDLHRKEHTTIDLNVARHWTNYFLAAFHGVSENFNIGKWRSLRIHVSGNVPKGSGLSSSSAFVCASVISLLYANLDRRRFSTQLASSMIADICIKCERYVGVMSGGMDQTICMMAHQGFAKFVSFIPELTAVNVQLPSATNATFVIANCLKEHTLMDERGTRNYNTRVVECRLGCILLAKRLGLRGYATMATFRQLQDATQFSFSDLLLKCREFLDDSSTIADIESALNENEDESDIKRSAEVFLFGLKRGAAVVKNLREIGYKLRLQSRALHVYSESERVIQFRDTCATLMKRRQSMVDVSDVDFYDNDNDNDSKVDAQEMDANAEAEAEAAVVVEVDEKAIMVALGELMTASQDSCRDLYDCSCTELDELVAICVKAGSLGSRLTGAGWGGCCVSLIATASLEAFMQQVSEEYYAIALEMYSAQHSGAHLDINEVMFPTTPSTGLTVINNIQDFYTNSSSADLLADTTRAQNRNGHGNSNAVMVDKRDVRAAVSALDILQIQNCINQYCLCLDSADGEHLANLFVEKGTLSVLKLEQEYVGRAAIEKFVDVVSELFVDVTHWESNIVIKFNPYQTQAANHSYWKGIKDGQLVAYGTHEDLFVRDEDSNGEWKFFEREIKHLWSAPTPQPTDNNND